MRFLADMGIAQSVVTWLSDDGHDALPLGGKLAWGALTSVQEDAIRVRHLPIDE